MSSLATDLDIHPEIFFFFIEIRVCFCMLHFLPALIAYSVFYKIVSRKLKVYEDATICARVVYDFWADIVFGLQNADMPLPQFAAVTYPRRDGQAELA